MEANAYALGLISVLVGLGLTDIAVSLHKLLRRGRAVTWDARVALVATYVVVLTIDMWFQSFSLSRVPSTRDLVFFLTLFLEYGLLVMAACACLPDDPSEAPNLHQFYEQERQYFWLVLAGFELSHIMHATYLMPRRILDGAAQDWAFFVAPIAIYLTLASVRNRWIHIALVILLIASTILKAQQHQLGG